MANKKEIVKKTGRPSSLTEDTVNKLEQAFAIGASDTEACSFAGISRQTYYSHLAKDKEFSDKIKRQKHLLPLKARKELKDLIEQGDSKAIFWYLDRVEKRNKVEGNIIVHNELERLAEQEYERLMALRPFLEEELDRLKEYAYCVAECGILRKKVALEGEILISEQTGSSYTNPVYTQLQGVQSRMDRLRDKLFPPQMNTVKPMKDIRDDFF